MSRSHYVVVFMLIFLVTALSQNLSAQKKVDLSQLERSTGGVKKEKGPFLRPYLGIMSGKVLFEDESYLKGVSINPGLEAGLKFSPYFGMYFHLEWANMHNPKLEDGTTSNLDNISIPQYGIGLVANLLRRKLLNLYIYTDLYYARTHFIANDHKISSDPGGGFNVGIGTDFNILSVLDAGISFGYELNTMHIYEGVDSQLTNGFWGIRFSGYLGR